MSKRFLRVSSNIAPPLNRQICWETTLTLIALCETDQGRFYPLPDLGTACGAK